MDRSPVHHRSDLLKQTTSNTRTHNRVSESKKKKTVNAFKELQSENLCFCTSSHSEDAAGSQDVVTTGKSL